MHQIKKPSPKLMPVAEVQKIFSEAQRVQLGKQEPVTLARAQEQQKTMKPRR